MNNNFCKNSKQTFMRIILHVLWPVLVLISCQKEVTNIKLPSSTPKLVIGCFISPQDSLLSLTLTRSNPIFGAGHTNSNNQPITDASVSVSNGTNSVILPYNSKVQQYAIETSTFPVTSGQSYSLTISTPEGENIFASCTVPALNLLTLDIDFIDTVSNTKMLNIKWKDIPGQINYYRLFGRTVDSNGFMGYMDPDNPLQDDNGKDGGEMSSRLIGENFDPDNNQIVAYEVYLLTIGAEYYKYQKSIDSYTDNDPFSEPSPIYTNIHGGLGIFAAYQQLYIRKP